MKNFRFLLTFSFFAVCLIFAGSHMTPAQQVQIAKNALEKENLATDTETDLPVTDAPAPAADPDKSARLDFNPLKRTGVQTAQTTPITLNDAIRRALENNNDIEVSRSDVKIAETSLRSLLGTYDGVFTIAPNYQRTSTTGETATNDFRVDTDFTKQIRRGGGNFSVFFDNTRTENRFAQAQARQGDITTGGAGALFSSRLGITYNQPLWRDFKIDQTRRQIKIQRKRIAQSDADFRRQTIEIISQVQQAYWDLVFALRDQQNRVANLNLSKENLRRIEAQIEAGTAPPLARAEVETELATREADLIVATQQVEVAENRLKQLILREPTAPEWTTQYVPTDSPVFSTDPIDLETAIKEAVENRPELRRLKLEREINQIDIDFFKNQTKPQIDLNTTFSLGGLSSTGSSIRDSVTVPLISGNPNLNADSFLYEQIRRFHPNVDAPPLITIDPSPSFLVGGFNQALRNIFRSDAPSYSAGLTISFPLKNQTAEANLAGARFQQERIQAQTRSQEQIVIAEVRNAVQAVESARQRVLAARRARENAEIQLEGEQKLFEAGRSTTFLLFQRENALTNARNSEIRAETDYNKALADLQRATSTTFRANNVEIDSPVQDDQ
jgi:outer membrane protein TolC